MILIPRLNSKFPPGAIKKFNRIKLIQAEEFFTLKLFGWKPLTSPDPDGFTIGMTNIEYQDLLNVIIGSEDSTLLQIPLTPTTRFSSPDGTIMVKLVGAPSKPLEMMTKGSNTLSWMESIETLQIEIRGVLLIDNEQTMLSFEDIRDNLIDPSSATKATNTKIFYISKIDPIIDHLSLDPIIGTKVTLTSGIASLLQYTGESKDAGKQKGGLLKLQYLVEPVRPDNAYYIKVVYNSFHFHSSLSGKDNEGTPLVISRISKLNSSDEEKKFKMVSDEYILDGVFPKNITGQKVQWCSWMNGEIHNKLRIWDSIWHRIGKPGQFAFNSKYGGVFMTDDKGEQWDELWKNLMPNREYVLTLVPRGGSTTFHADIRGALGGGRVGEGNDKVPPWYNTFSFFENVYSTKYEPASAGDPAWKTSNSFFIFDVERTETSPSIINEGLGISNPNYSIMNPNLSENDYDDLTNDASIGSVTINGTTFSSTWDNPAEKIEKDDKIYNWEETDENKKNIVLTPGNDYIKRLKKILSSGGQLSSDNDTNVKIGDIQSVSARHPFPNGDGSIFITYPNNIFFSKTTCINTGWPVNNELIFKVPVETKINELTFDHWGGEKITVSFFDKEFNPAIGLNADGLKVPLPPTTIPAANKDKSGNPLKTRSKIIFGFTI